MAELERGGGINLDALREHLADPAAAVDCKQILNLPERGRISDEALAHLKEVVESNLTDLVGADPTEANIQRAGEILHAVSDFQPEPETPLARVGAAAGPNPLAAGAGPAQVLGAAGADSLSQDLELPKVQKDGSTQAQLEALEDVQNHSQTFSILKNDDMPLADKERRLREILTASERKSGDLTYQDPMVALGLRTMAESNGGRSDLDLARAVFDTQKEERDRLALLGPNQQEQLIREFRAGIRALEESAEREIFAGVGGRADLVRKSIEQPALLTGEERSALRRMEDLERDVIFPLAANLNALSVSMNAFNRKANSQGINERFRERFNYDALANRYYGRGVGRLLSHFRSELKIAGFGVTAGAFGAACALGAGAIINSASIFSDPNFTHYFSGNTGLVAGAVGALWCGARALGWISSRLKWRVRASINGPYEVAKESISDAALIAMCVGEMIQKTAEGLEKEYALRRDALYPPSDPVRAARAPKSMKDCTEGMMRMIDLEYSKDIEDTVVRQEQERARARFEPRRQYANICDASKRIEALMHGGDARFVALQRQSVMERLEEAARKTEPAQDLAAKPEDMSPTGHVSRIIRDIRTRGWENIDLAELRARVDRTAAAMRPSEGSVDEGGMVDAGARARSLWISQTEGKLQEELRSIPQLHATDGKGANINARTDMSFKIRHQMMAYKKARWIETQEGIFTPDALASQHLTLLNELQQVDVEENDEAIERMPNKAPLADQVFSLKYPKTRWAETIATVTATAGTVGGAIYAYSPSLLRMLGL